MRGSRGARQERAPGLWAVSVGRPRAADRPDVKDDRHAGGRGVEIRTAPQLAYVAGGALRMSRGRSVQLAAASQDVFPFKPQWLGPAKSSTPRTAASGISAIEMRVYTANGHIEATIDGPTGVSVDSVHREGVAAAQHVRDRASRARTGRAAEADRHRQPGRRRRTAARSRSPRWAISGCCRSADTPMQVTNDAAVELDPAWSPDSTRLAFASDRGGHMDLWVHDLATTRMSQLTRGARRRLGPGLVARRHPHRLPARSPDADHDRPSARSTPLRLRRRPTLGELGRPTWSADSNSIAVGGLFPYSNRYREGLNQIAAVLRDHERHVVVGARRRTLGRQPSGHRAGVVARRLPHGVRQRRHAVGRPGRRTRRRHWTAAGDRRRSTGVAELGGRFAAHRLPDAARSAPRPRRRQPARSDSARAHLAQRARRPNASWSTPDTCFDGMLEAMRGESDIVIESRRHPQHRGASRRAAHRRGRRRLHRVS